VVWLLGRTPLVKYRDLSFDASYYACGNISHGSLISLVTALE
jgi:hypothetical protein